MVKNEAFRQTMVEYSVHKKEEKEEERSDSSKT